MRLFQDAAGTIPAYEAGQPVGKVARAAGSVDATQATALSRPTLARWPKTGRRNLITGSETFTSGTANAGETTITRDAEPGPDGAGFAPVVSYAGASPGRFQLVGAIDVVAGRTYSLSIWIKLISGSSVMIYDPATGSTFSILPQLIQGQWVKIQRPGIVATASGSRQFQLRLSTGGSVAICRGQYEEGPIVTPYQNVISPINITEAGVPDVWHLWNDGGDSLMAPLPTGAHEVATVTPMGRVSYTGVTGDGTGNNILFGERVADIFSRPGALSDAERLRLEEYWQQRYGAGYLVPPGMLTGGRLMRQDSVGALEVSAAGQPVGLMSLDAPPSYGAELRGSFAAGASGTPTTPSTYTPADGSGTVTRDTVSAQGTVFMTPLPAGTYEVSFATMSAGIYLRTASATGAIVKLFTPADLRGVLTITPNANETVWLTAGADGVVTTFSGFSIRRVSSQLAAQPTALSRPTLARLPRTGRRNMITWSEDFSHSDWTLNGGQIAAGVYSETTASVAHFLGRTSGSRPRITGGATYTVTWRITRGGARYIQIPGVTWFGGANSYTNFDLEAISVSAQLGPQIPRITKSGDVYTLSITVTAGNDELVNQPLIAAVPAADSSRLPTRVGDPSLTFTILSCQFEESAAPTPYQKVMTNFDVSEAGVPDIWHLFNDGGDSLPAILPAGAWEIAWVNHLGVIGYASVNSDGTTGTDLLRAERMADVALKRGRFTSYEKAQLETQWGKYKP